HPLPAGQEAERHAEAAERLPDSYQERSAEAGAVARRVDRDQPDVADELSPPVDLQEPPQDGGVRDHPPVRPADEPELRPRARPALLTTDPARVRERAGQHDGELRVVDDVVLPDRRPVKIHDRSTRRARTPDSPCSI